MRRISDLVEEHVAETPLVEEFLGLGLLNLSALARHLRPRLRQALERPVSVASVVMALKRLGPRVASRTKRPTTRTARPSDLTVRSNLVELTYHVSTSIRDKHRKLLIRMQKSDDAFVTYTEGVTEAMLMVSAGHEATAEEVFAGERQLSKVRHLSAIVIRLAPGVVETPGVYYSILKSLAWQNINVVDVVSTRTEFTIMVHDDVVDRAFSALRRYLYAPARSAQGRNEERGARI